MRIQPLPRNATRIDKIGVIWDLFHNYKDTFFRPEEFTAEKYDFLVEEGIISLTLEQKTEFYAKAKAEYIKELEELIKFGTLQQIKDAKRDLDFVKWKIAPEQKRYIQGKAKGMAVRAYFDTVESIQFNPNK